MRQVLTLLLLLSLTQACDRLQPVRQYQQRATDKCLAAGHTKEQCEPLSYPSGR
jgi:hypothetical protein